VGKVIDLVGKRFGRLVVTELSHVNKGGAQWICACDCGNIKTISGHSLRRGCTKSCGCKQKEHIKELGLTKRKNIIGNKYGRLTVIEFSHVDEKTKSAFWICECDCGNMVTVHGNKLRRGHTKSCGCLQKEFASKTFFIDLTGQKFNSLLVEEFDSFKNGISMWKCLCECGNYKIASGINLKQGCILSCGCKRRTILKKYEESDKSFTERELIRKSIEYIEWRKSVFETGKYTCIKCGQVGGYLEAHHVFSFDKNVEVRFDIKNGIVFCKHCHTSFHKEYGFGYNTKKQLKEFLITLS